MLPLIKRLCCILFITAAMLSSASYAERSVNIPVLCYHNFNPTVNNSMTMTPEKFETQLKWLKDNGYTVIPMQEAVDYLLGKRDSLPPKPVVISADDGWQSQYKYMVPLAKKYNVPVTFFIYPGTISEGKNTMTWDELKELQQTGLFDIQGHTYTHPNFKQEKRHRSIESYDKFVQKELAGSKKMLEEKVGKSITILAWPFGIYNDYLEQQAANAGYVMAFSIDDRKADRNDKAMAQPRFMLLQNQTMNTFISHVKSGG